MKLNYTTPFPDKIVEFLQDVDLACRNQAIDWKTQLDEDPKWEPDDTDVAWMAMIKAYGILYNRAIDTGWLKGFLVEEK